MRLNKILLGILALSTAAFADGAEFSQFLSHHVYNSDFQALPFGLGHIDLRPFQFKVLGIQMGLSSHIIMMFIGAFLCLTLIPFSARRINTVPTNRFGHAIESLVVFMKDDFIYPFLGEKDGARFLPFLLTIFFFLLSLNLVGMVPYLGATTSNINFTGAFALMIFVIFNFMGMKHNGIFHYFINLVPKGVPLPIQIFMFPLEIISIFTKSLTLALRLCANLTAGHMCIFSILGMLVVFKQLWWCVPGLVLPFSLFNYLLELLVAVLQAYVFTLLSTLYISMAVHQEH